MDIYIKISLTILKFGFYWVFHVNLYYFYKRETLEKKQILSLFVKRDMIWLMIKFDLEVSLRLQNRVNLSFLKFVKNCGQYGQKSTI